MAWQLVKHRDIFTFVFTAMWPTSHTDKFIYSWCR